MTNIKQHTANGRNWLVVNTQSSVCKDPILYNKAEPPVLEWEKSECYFGVSDTELPPGQYRIHCTFPGCTEDEAAEVVEWHERGWYINYYDLMAESIALASIQSLTDSLFPDSTDCKFVILEQI